MAREGNGFEKVENYTNCCNDIYQHRYTIYIYSCSANNALYCLISFAMWVACGCIITAAL